MLSFYAVVGPGAAAADAQPAAERHISGSFTNRGLNNYAAHVQHGLPLEDLLTMALGAQSERGQGKTALEIGCGEAHALLDLQQMYPAMATHCQNSAGYAAWCRGFDPTGVNPNRTKCGNGPTQQPPGGQNISTATWKTTAASFNISTELPRWPHVTFSHFGGTRSLPFPSSQFHFIMSQHALDEGKIMRPRDEFPQILREVIRRYATTAGSRSRKLCLVMSTMTILWPTYYPAQSTRKKSVLGWSRRNFHSTEGLCTPRYKTTRTTSPTPGRDTSPLTSDMIAPSRMARASIYSLLCPTALSTPGVAGYTWSLISILADCPIVRRAACDGICLRLHKQGRYRGTHLTTSTLCIG